MGSRFAWGIAPGFVDLTIASAGNIATFPDTLSQLIAPAAAPVPTQSQWGGIALSVVLGLFSCVGIRRRYDHK